MMDIVDIKAFVRFISVLSGSWCKCTKLDIGYSGLRTKETENSLETDSLIVINATECFLSTRCIIFTRGHRSSVTIHIEQSFMEPSDKCFLASKVLLFCHWVVKKIILQLIKCHILIVNVNVCIFGGILNSIIMK